MGDARAWTGRQSIAIAATEKMQIDNGSCDALVSVR
jgi:hypothetical protein